MYLSIIFSFFIACLTGTCSLCNANVSDGLQKKALIFGVTGQDGTYLTELLLSKNYEVHGVSRKLISKKAGTQGVLERLVFHKGDVANSATVMKLIQLIQPDEIYNLAAQSQVKLSFDSPLETAEVNALGTLHILEAIKLLGLEKQVRYFQAASSELFGNAKESPQHEKTDFYPRSPYAIAKLYSYWITVNYREAYGIFGCNGILFNHESPLRPESFITRKITLGACRYKLGQQEVLYLGNLDSQRDWGYAKDYVESMWLMLQQEAPNDYVIATEKVHSVRDFVECAFKEVGVIIKWEGSGVNEHGIDVETGKIVVAVDPQFFRPAEVDTTLGNASKAKRMLNWEPRTCFDELVKIMIESDYENERLRLRQEEEPKCSTELISNQK